jgi:ribosome biogenesis protein Nip4
MQRKIRKDKVAHRPQSYEEFCKLFTEEQIPNVVRIGKRYFYDPHGLLAYAQEHRMDPFGVGLFLGEQKQQFLPTSALVDLLAQRCDKRVAVGNKSAWLYLCGRDVLMDGVLTPGVHADGDYVIVTDIDERVIGAGRVVGHYNPQMRNKIYVKHVIDKGEYLRRER